ncbi:MAG: PIN domain-containing protein [Candidatus Methanoplasma sp.]|nr:PIN domain-containing protein [Candidatus Methanoplasma sp.]
MIYYLDTDTCVFFLKNTYPGLTNRLLTHHPSEIVIPSMVVAELMHGAHKSAKVAQNLEQTRKFLWVFDVAPFNETAACIYGDLRSRLEGEGNAIGPGDLVIAATVMSENGILVTHKTKEFSRVPNLSIEDWTE